MPTIDKEIAAKRAEKRQATLGFYSPKEIAEMFGFDERTMAIWRNKKVGPCYTKLGKNVYYKLSDIRAWIDANVVKTGDAANSPSSEVQFDMFPECDCCKPTAEEPATEVTTTQFAASEAFVTVPMSEVEVI